MLMKLASGLLLLFAFSIVAQTPSLPAVDVPGSQIQSFLKALPKNAVSDLPIRVADVGGYHVAVYGVSRPKSVPHQEANLHQTKNSEIYYILEGGGTLVTGGTMPGAKPLKPGDKVNLQSARIEGGVVRHVGKGDVVIIPGATPHQWSGQDGDLKYLIFRTDTESRIPLK
jgi:mannose-6-phosphate isomerase-like protein (cupin superfamily)